MLMIPIKWPPELDGIKIAQDGIIARVKNTDIWIELDLKQPGCLAYLLSQKPNETILAWIESFLNSA